MKKIATLLILCSLALSLTACSGKTDDSYTELSSKESSTTVQPAETSASSAQSQPSAKPAISYYNAALSERYETYKAKNTGITEEEAVLAVNMGLDFAFYEKIKPIKNQSSLLALCNKYYNLQESYEPTDLVAVRNENSGLANMRLREEANNAFNKMADAAKKDGRKLVVTSSYRPYSSQKRLYNNYVSSDGKQAADTYSARPGHSEHQTGLVVDLAGTNSSGAYDLNAFEASAEYTWMRANAYKYGFILRFPKEDEKITGYMYEPWHYRYVGLDTAKIIYEEKLCFEKYWAKYLWNKEN